MGAPSDEDDFEFPDWQYHAAVVETDRFKVGRLVQAAEDAISKRLESIAERSGHEVERRAMLDALESLDFLKIESTKAQLVAQSQQYKVNPFRWPEGHNGRGYLMIDHSAKCGYAVGAD
jgi:hypothetical protein